MAKAALEMAVLDAELRMAGISLSAFLGGVNDVVTPGVASASRARGAELLDSVAEYLDAGYRRVKLKIQPGWDLVPVSAVRDRFGDDLMLQVDANSAYRRTDADHLADLDQFSLLLIEQPLDEDDLVGHAELARRITTRFASTSRSSLPPSAATAISMRACSVVNIKAGRVGGYIEARAVHDVCASQGVPVWCGGMLETGLGRAANLALASLPGFTLPGDISATDRYFAEDITPPFRLHDGTMEVPTGPGLGVEVLRPVLDAHTVQSETVTERGAELSQIDGDSARCRDHSLRPVSRSTAQLFPASRPSRESPSAARPAGVARRDREPLLPLSLPHGCRGCRVRPASRRDGWPNW